MEKIAQKIYDSIPQEDKERAAQNNVYYDDTCWHCGKVALEQIEKYPSHIMAVYSAVSRLCHVSKDTVRERARIFALVGEFVPQYPALMYSHWRAACGMNSQHGLPGISVIATQAEEYSSAWGELPSVDTMRSWVSEANGEPGTVFPVYWQRFQRGVELLEAAADDDEFPQRETVKEHLAELKKIKLGKSA